MIDTNPVTREWLELFNSYGWVLLLPVMERIWAARKQSFLRPGLISDVIYPYQPVVIEPWLMAGITAYLLPASHGMLQGSLHGAPLWLCIPALILCSEVTFYFVHYLCHHNPVLWEFHRVHHSSVVVDSFSTSRFHLIDKALFVTPFIACVSYLGIDPEAVFLLIP
jgi:sterol desaturase/sphingolipid hydroxylase (fatty acid hydroxylase superfamily)